METQAGISESGAKRERAIYEEYAGIIFRHCLRWCHSRDAAEDMRQQVFIRVFRSLDDFRQESNLRTWIYRITENVCIENWNRNKKERMKFEKFVFEENYSQSLSADGGSRVLVEQVLELADSKTQRALELIYFQGLSHQDVAEVFGVSRVAITRRLTRFKSKATSALGREVIALQVPFH